MNKQKIDVTCKLSEISSSVCKVNSKKRLNEIAELVDQLHNNLYKKKVKTKRKSRKQKNIHFFKKEEDEATKESVSDTLDSSIPSDLSTTISTTIPSMSKTSFEQPKDMEDNVDDQNMDGQNMDKKDMDTDEKGMNMYKKGLDNQGINMNKGMNMYGQNMDIDNLQTKIEQLQE